MTRVVLGAVRNMLRILRGGDPDATGPPLWRPAFEESTARKLSAPAHWLCAVTDIGKTRIANEDGYFLSTDCKLWIVADGMGGHAAGKLASTLTIQAIAHSMSVAGMRAPTSAAFNPDDWLIKAFDSAQEQVAGRGLSDAECRGMGSTAIAGVVHGEALHVCHVGDARAYHFSQGRTPAAYERSFTGLASCDGRVDHPRPSQATSAKRKNHSSHRHACRREARPHLHTVNARGSRSALLRWPMGGAHGGGDMYDCGFERIHVGVGIDAGGSGECSGWTG